MWIVIKNIRINMDHVCDYFPTDHDGDYRILLNYLAPCDNQARSIGYKNRALRDKDLAKIDGLLLTDKGIINDCPEED